MAIRKLYQIKLTGGTSEEEILLRSPAREICEINEQCMRIISDMRDTIASYPFCRGLSAPQIGESLAISIIDMDHSGPEGDLVLINPIILETKGKKDKKRESCMSVWGKQGEIERRDKVLVEYRDINFQIIQREFSGYESRCIQHEIDHLRGVIYIDKLVPGAELSEAPFFGDFPEEEKL